MSQKFFKTKEFRNLQDEWNRSILLFTDSQSVREIEKLINGQTKKKSEIAFIIKKIQNDLLVRQQCLAAYAAGKKPKRVPKQFLGAFSFAFAASVRDLLDDELSHQLMHKALRGDQKAAKELEFLAKFNVESYSGFFVHPWMSDPSTLHSKQQQKQIEKERNARRRDVFNKNQRVEKNVEEAPSNLAGQEEAIIALIEIEEK